MKRAEIQIEGHLDEGWKEWFEGFDLTYTESGDTILAGDIVDQAALFGLISKLRDLGVRLISVNLKETDPKRPRSD